MVSVALAFSFTVAALNDLKMPTCPTSIPATDVLPCPHAVELTVTLLFAVPVLRPVTLVTVMVQVAP